ncbi:MAG: alpha-2-macroglobulin family protein, partial [Patescibacteria group bacterium]
AETKVITRRDLMVEPLVPRILRHGDTAVVGATVHNTTDSTRTVNAAITVEGIKIDGSRDKSVTLSAHSRTAVNWTVHVPQNGSSAKVTVLAKGGNLEDGFETSLPILPFSVAEVIGTSGLLEKSITESLEPPEDILKDVGHLTISVTPNVGNGLSDGLGYLVNFEYGCSEQTTSAVLASLAYNELVTQKITKQDDALMAKAKTKIEEGVKRLVAMQKSDGGWGLWPESEKSTPHYSAYVFWGLTRAAKAGFTVDPSVLDRTDKYLRDSLSQPIEGKEYEQLSANERAQALYTLSERDPRELSGHASSLYEKRNLLSGFGKSFLAIALGNVEKFISSSRINTLLGEVAQKIERRDPTHILFREDSGYDSYWSSDTRSTAIYLQALLRLDPKNRDIEPLVRSLMEKKRDGYWESTQSTAMSFLALAEYARLNPITGDATDVEVFLQNQRLGYLKYPLGALSPSQSKLIPLSEVLKRGSKVQIGLEKESSQRYFYDVTLKTYRAIQNIEPFENGFSLMSDVYAIGDEKREHPLTGVAQGETVRVRLKLLVPKKRTYVALESHLPAGLEAIDFQLK